MKPLKRNYIGLGTSPHDPSLAIVDSRGQLVFAEDTERYLQNKRAWCSPPDDFIRIAKLLKEYCEPDAEFVIASSWRSAFFKRLQFFSFGPFKGLIKRKIGAENYDMLRCIASYANVRHGINTEAHLQRVFGRRPVIRREYEHHLTHSAAACYSSPYAEAVSVVIDGLGESTSCKMFHFRNGGHLPISRKPSEGSFGQFYSFLCELCGFDPIGGEEWKVMGLAPYGGKNDRYYGLLRSLLRIDGLRIREGRHSAAAVRQLLELRRRPDQPAIEFADLAYTGQLVFSEYVDELLSHVHALNLSDNLVLSGGCALNSAYVGQLAGKGPFKNSFVFCAPADNGNSVGAAWLAYHQDHPQAWTPRTQVQSPYLGSRLSTDMLDKLLRYGGLEPIKTGGGPELYTQVAEELSKGRIVAWVQGRAEFGPRALGNRSILADPRRRDVKELINAKVKFREEFRPFAPSILAEHGDEYFENYRDTPYMERALRFRPEQAARVPGVVHVDGTGRLQSVKRELNEKYYELIKAFHGLTGVPILLNTSFNVMGKPIAHSVEDAIAIFLTSGIDLLVLDNYIFKKRALGALADVDAAAGRSPSTEDLSRTPQAAVA
ncbi:carbamoyltransferase [Aquabacterium sp. A7-Y]|uniref:carbamoyltransferase family protein n=1 Tax=Aquabacterium sp. A7-Y TaxID=1349605 RepID=UPI00223E3DAE|nr:carbamoyltransferase C-terminal domain-containing protein [Aquabacterium sp. A7-Y]MCW7538513.1 carbamoyltransferase [Aquabacterium sp. A7-Y]